MTGNPPDAYPGAPAYFRRVYDQRDRPLVEHDNGAMVVMNLTAGQRLVIYGYAIRSSYPHDRRQERLAWERTRSFFAECFSPAAPAGEIGFVPAAEVEPISALAFDAARVAGWPQ